MEERAKQYCIGQTLSNKLQALLWFLSSTMIIHITLLFVSYITEPDVVLQEESHFVLITVATHITLISIYSLLCIQGLLVRDIYQVVLSTLFVSIICILEIVVRFGGTLRIHTIFSMLVDTIPIFTGIAIISIILFTSELRHDIGWFYYKSYGAGYNTRHGIRMSMNTIFKLNVQVFISFWFFKLKITGSWHFLVVETVLYCVLLFLFNLDLKFRNNYYIRFTFMLIDVLIMSYYIIAVIDNEIVLTEERLGDLTELEKDYQKLLMLVKVTLLILLNIFAVLDTYSFPAYQREENNSLDGHFKKRMLISQSSAVHSVPVQRIAI